MVNPDSEKHNDDRVKVKVEKFGAGLVMTGIVSLCTEVEGAVKSSAGDSLDFKVTIHPATEMSLPLQITGATRTNRLAKKKKAYKCKCCKG